MSLIVIARWYEKLALLVDGKLVLIMYIVTASDLQPVYDNNAIVKFADDIYTVSQKVSTFKLSVTSSNLNGLLHFLGC